MVQWRLTPRYPGSDPQLRRARIATLGARGTALLTSLIMPGIGLLFERSAFGDRPAQRRVTLGAGTAVGRCRAYQGQLAHRSDRLFGGCADDQTHGAGRGFSVSITSGCAAVGVYPVIRATTVVPSVMTPRSINVNMPYNILAT
jgi:hypothetical protein